MASQISIPVSVRPEEIARKQSLGAAIELCAELGGFGLDKSLQQELHVDKAQFSRWQSGAEGVIWPKFERLMDVCGNDAPVLWMLNQRGYDLNSLRRQESETERQLRAANEALDQERLKNRVLIEALTGRVSA